MALSIKIKADLTVGRLAHINVVGTLTVDKLGLLTKS